MSATESSIPEASTNADAFAFLDEVSDSAEAPEVATPLPADGALEDDAAALQEQPRQAEAESQTKVEEPAPPKEAAKPEDDPDLTADENEVVRSRPEAEQPEIARKLKAARFEDHYKNPDKPAEEVRQYLEDSSKSRYEALEETILDKKFADPDAFAKDYYTKKPEAYGKLALAVYKGAPEYFARALTGREGVTPEQVTQALDFYESHKDAPDLPAREFTADEQAEMRTYLDDELVEKILAKPEAKPKPETVAAKQPEAAEKAEATKAPEKPAERPDADNNPVWRVAQEDVEGFVTRKADVEYELKVTPEERELSPDVADLKDDKRHLLFFGREGVLPPFYTGLFEWGKDNAEFKKEIDRLVYFSDKGEEKNAREVAARLLPYTDKYMQERLKHPAFARIDARIKRFAAEANPPTEADTVIPGAPNLSQQDQAKEPWAFLDQV